MPQVQVRLQLRAAQVEISILQTQIFARECFRTGIELKRRRARVVQRQQLPRVYFDVASREFRIARILITGNHVAHHRDHVFVPQFLRLRVRVRRVFSVEDNLSDTGAVAQIDKCEFTKIATLRDPTHQHYLLADINGTQISARMRAFQISEVIQHSSYPCAISKRLPPGSRT